MSPFFTCLIQIQYGQLINVNILLFYLFLIISILSSKCLHLVVHWGQENIDRAATLSMFSWPEKSPQLLHVSQPSCHSYGCSGHNTKECSLHVLLPTVTLKNYYIRYDFDRVVIFKAETNIFVTSFVWRHDPNLTFMYNHILIWHGDGCPPSHWRITTNSSKINKISQLVPVCRLMYAND